MHRTLSQMQRMSADHVLHGILLYDCDDSSFNACDPLYGKIRLMDEEVETYMQTPVGRMCISVGLKPE